MGSTSPGDPRRPNADTDAVAGDPGTLERQMARLPDHNPNPVLRVERDGTILYANPAAAPILLAWGVGAGEVLPDVLAADLRAAADLGAAVGSGAAADLGAAGGSGAAAGDGASQSVEVAAGHRTFELRVVPDGDVLQLYGTDVTARRLVNRLPDLNPNPVLRLTEGGRIEYANPASAELLGLLGVQLGQALPDAECNEVFEALSAAPAGHAARPVEIVRGNRTFALVAVRVPEVDQINVYVTEVTAQRAVAKFPDENPNPVFRVAMDGTLIYANPASKALLDGIGCWVGASLPENLLNPILVRSRDGGRTVVEAESDDHLYALLPIAVPEFGFINVYGTDITAARQLEQLHRENERLLLNILPEPIAERLRAGETMIADRFEDVTLMFADIVGFTELSSQMSPDELVGVLNEVFTVFDLLADEYRLEKVKTIGDAYMIVGGLPGPMDDHLDRVADMALALAECVNAIGSADRLGIRFRVGIHVGPVVAGVIGRKKFIYDVWGDTVNIASRMESHGISGRIQVTGAVEERLRGRFEFEQRGLIEIKGKGPTPTWFLVGRTSHDRLGPPGRSAEASAVLGRLG